MTDQAQAWKTVVDKYYTPEQQAGWQEHMADAPEFWQQGYIEKWKELSGRIEASLPLDPASDEALAFVQEWFGLLEPFSRNATPKMWAGSTRLYENMTELESTVDPGFSKRVWDFISLAASVAKNAGRDVGPLPKWMQTPRS